MLIVARLHPGYSTSACFLAAFTAVNQNLAILHAIFTDSLSMVTYL